MILLCPERLEEMAQHKPCVLDDEREALERIDKAIRAISKQNCRDVPPHLIAEREACLQRIRDLEASQDPR